MDRVYFGANVLIVAGCFGLGLMLSRTRAAVPAAVFLTLVLCARGWLRWNTHLEDALFPRIDYLYFVQWHIPLFVMLAALAARRLPRERDRRAVKAFACFLLLVAVYQFGWMLKEPGLLKERGWSEDGVMLQTTGYTCVAASAATLLKLTTGKQVSEYQMARDCLVMKGQGAEDLGAARGLRINLAGLPERYRVRIVKASIADIKEGRVKLPAMSAVLFEGLAPHMVVLVERAPGGVIVADPMGDDVSNPPKGRYFRSWEAYEKIRHESFLIVVERTGPPPAPGPSGSRRDGA